MNKQLIPAHKRYCFSDYIWLVYLVFFLIEPGERSSLTYWLESLGVILIFVFVYLAFLRFAHLQIRLGLLGVMVIMGAVFYPWNQGAPAFFIYAAALLPLTIDSLLWIASLLSLDAIILIAIGRHFHLSIYSWLINAILIFVVGLANIASAQKMRADYKLRMKQEELEALAALAERERIARDLHDVLGHTLSVIVLKGELAGRLLERECQLLSASGTETTALMRARVELNDLERIARTALAEVREAIGGYRARGLQAEIDSARGTLAAAGVTLVTEGDLKPSVLTAAEETVLALALREAVTNIVRHAQATSCHLHLVFEHGQHRLSIEDNGPHAIAREGNGLRGMRERVESLGGQLSLSREGGTHLLIELPLRTT
jgi:two-component system sensor histidine kinase DesK